MALQISPLTAGLPSTTFGISASLREAPPYQNKKRSGKASRNERGISATLRHGLALPEIPRLLGTRMAGRHGAEQGFSAAVQPAKIAIGWCRIDAEAPPGENMRLN